MLLAIFDGNHYYKLQKMANMGLLLKIETSNKTEHSEIWSIVNLNML